MDENTINKNHYNFATWVIYNCFTDIGEASHLLLEGKKKDSSYWKKWFKAKEDIKYTRMRFGKSSPLVGLWADSAKVDERLVRGKIIKFALSYPHVKCLE